MSWDIHFPNPIMTPQGKALVTLRDAGRYIAALPEQIHDKAAWQTAMHVLMKAADDLGPIEFARLGMMQALYPKGEPVYRSCRSDPKWRTNYKQARDR
jgi:hypothetical protein